MKNLTPKNIGKVFFGLCEIPRLLRKKAKGDVQRDWVERFYIGENVKFNKSQEKSAKGLLKRMNKAIEHLDAVVFIGDYPALYYDGTGYAIRVFYVYFKFASEVKFLFIDSFGFVPAEDDSFNRTLNLVEDCELARCPAIFKVVYE